MKTITALLSLTLTAAILSAQPRRLSSGNQPPPDTSTKKPGRVEGVVTSSTNGEAVRKATVTLHNTSQQFAYATTSDIAGHFVFDRVEPGPYMITADRAGYMPAQDTGRGPTSFKQLQIDEDQMVKAVEVKLMPLATADGHVLDEDGEPIIRAQVRALRYNYNQGRKQLNPQGFASTNDLGEYQFTDLQPGRYYFVASATLRRASLPPHTRSNFKEETYPATYYPNGSDVGQAAASELAPGGRVTNLDFRLSKVPAFHIRGKVIDGQTGQLAKNIGVQVNPRGGPLNGFQSFAQVQQDGTFDAAGIAAGSYVVTAQRSQGTVNELAHQAVNIADQDVEILLTLSTGMDIAGTLLFDGTAPPAQMNINVVLQADQGGASARVEAADGSFVVHNVFPDVYQLGVYGYFPGKYLKSIRFGDQDAPSGQIDLTQQTSGSLTLYFGADPGQISGTVQDRSGQPAVGAMITIAPADGLDGRQDLFKQGSTDKNGSFTIKDVAPGSYKVFAWETVDRNMVQVAEFRKPFESQAVSVSLGANAQESVQLKVISTADVEAGKSKMQ